MVIEKGHSTTSHLLIQRATGADSGVYRCVPENTVEASINLHILKGLKFIFFQKKYNLIIFLNREESGRLADVVGVAAAELSPSLNHVRTYFAVNVEVDLVQFLRTNVCEGPKESDLLCVEGS